MATSLSFSETCEGKNKRICHVENLPAIDEDKDKMWHKVCNSNEDDSQRKTLLSIGCVANFIFYDDYKYEHSNVRTSVWNLQDNDANAENNFYSKSSYKFEVAHISVWDWFKRICLIFARKTILCYESVTFYVPVYISNHESLLFNQKLQDRIDKLTGEKEDLKKKNNLLTEKLKEHDDFLKARTSKFQQEKNKLYQEWVELMEKNRSLKNELSELKNKHEQLKVEYKEALHDLGKLSVERSADMNRVKKANGFKTTFQSKASSTHVMLSDVNRSNSTSGCNETMREQELHCQHNQVHYCRTQDSTSNSPDWLMATTSTSNQQSSNSIDDLAKSFANATEEKNEASAEKQFVCELPENISVTTDNRNSTTGQLSLPVEVEESRAKEFISLMNYEPCSVVTTEVRNIYKLLLLTMADRLLLSDIVELKDWANERFSIPTNLSATDVVLRLDQKGVISASDLCQLQAFFESILRFDLVYLIDQFSSGDYPFLRKLIFSNNPRSETSMHNSNKIRRSRVANTYSIPRRALGARGNSEVVSDGQVGTNQRGNMGHANSSSSTDTPTTSGVNAMKMPRPSSKGTTQQNAQAKFNGTSQSRPNDSQSSRKRNEHEQKWLCNHYKRRCYVKFECCNKFWPCHRCHNNESTCGRKKLKSRDTTMVRCAECGKEQQFGENDQFCVSCNIKFADFYCGLCKHLTGMDDHPYHCDKCGICRIHGDRSFHCDVCGVCLDVQLRGNHKCREGSAHDECCICLEDAFTGCQILPCSHKVHKNCATQMIQSGITRCPICRESFAHMLTKRSIVKKNTKR